MSKRSGAVPYRLPDLHVIGLNAMGGERLAQVERLGWVWGVVGEYETGDELG